VLDGAFVCPHAGCCHSYKDHLKLREHLGLAHDQQQVSKADLQQCFTTVFKCSTCQENIKSWTAFRHHQCGLQKPKSKRKEKTRGNSRVGFVPEISGVNLHRTATVEEGAVDEPEVVWDSSASGVDMRSGGASCTQCQQTFSSYGQMLRHRFMTNH